MSNRYLSIVALIGTSVLSGCAKNVDRINFTKWGNSYLTPQGSSVDTSAHGGTNTIVGSQAPQNGINTVPKASVGGAYHRSFATSPSYRMVGGFHVGK